MVIEKEKVKRIKIAVKKITEDTDRSVQYDAVAKKAVFPLAQVIKSLVAKARDLFAKHGVKETKFPCGVWGSASQKLSNCVSFTYRSNLI